MARVGKKNKELTKVKDIKLGKISVFMRKSILKSILRIMTMEHGGFRNFKSVKNINRLFANLDMGKYATNQEAIAYIWDIAFMSKQWLAGIATPDIAVELAKKQQDAPPMAVDILCKSLDDKNDITAPEAKTIFDMISEALQYGFVTSLKDEYINLLDDVNMDEPGALQTIMQRLFDVSKSLLDIKYNTNMVANKVEFNTADIDSMRNALSATIESLSSNSSIFKTGIRRLNTLLSPGYMNGRLYVYCGVPGAGKSIMLLKSALDIRKYNPGYKTKTPGMRPCVLYITMENTFTETIERIWNMCFDEPVTNYTEDEALSMICNALGVRKILKDDVPVTITDDNGNQTSLLGQLMEKEDERAQQNIEMVIQYYPYKSINTDDLYTIIQDLKDENLEVCAFVFDYIKRIEPSTPVNDNAKMELDRIINELKALAVITDIPVITAHQMNRAAVSVIDNAAKSGKGDLGRQATRDQIGDSIDILQVADWLAVVNAEYQPGTDNKFMTINVLKRRRIDAAEAEFAKYTYLAHPFAPKNGLRLLDDINLDKVLSLQSLSTDVDMIPDKERANAAPRLQTLNRTPFDEDYI